MRIKAFYKKPLFKALLFAGLFLATMGAGEGTAAAACGVHTGSSGSLAGAIVESYWYDDGGVRQNSNNTGVRVTTFVGNYGGTNYSSNNNVVRTNASSTAVIERHPAGDFNQISGCGDGTSVVLGYGATSSRFGVGGPWALDCDASIHGVGNEQPFTFTGLGVPAGARAGGSWSTVTARAPNGFTTHIELYYTQPPADDPPAVNSISASCTQVRVRATDPEGNAYHAQLIVDGVDAPASVGFQTGRPSGSDTIFDVTSWRDFSTHSFRVRITDSVTGDAVLSGADSAGPCLKFLCGNIVSSPSDPEPGESFNVTVSFNVALNDGTDALASLGSRGNPHAYYVRLAVTPGVLADTQIDSGNIDPGDSSVIATRSGLTAPAAGLYDANSAIRHTPFGANLAACSYPDSIEVVSKPYFHVYGGDLSTGNNYSAPCVGSGRVRAFNKGPAGSYAGAGGQLATFAGGQVDEFVSASLRTIAPQVPKALTFANTGSGAASSTYGGGNTDGPCVVDYWENAPDTPNVGSSISVSSLASGVYYSNTASAMSSAPFLGRHIIYVEGDLRITSNLSYSSVSWGGVGAVPSFYVIVRGNIHVAPGVSELDGVYIAVPNGGSGGHIYTCSNGGTPSETLVANSCDDNRLRLNGQMIATTLHLLRTIDTLRASTARESLGASKAAEQFVESPEVWLGAPEAPLVDQQAQYENITSLPPIL